ncbi:unnamed protein product [Lampetra planeri]
MDESARRYRGRSEAQQEHRNTGRAIGHSPSSHLGQHKQAEAFPTNAWGYTARGVGRLARLLVQGMKRPGRPRGVQPRSCTACTLDGPATRVLTRPAGVSGVSAAERRPESAQGMSRSLEFSCAVDCCPVWMDHLAESAKPISLQRGLAGSRQVKSSNSCRGHGAGQHRLG